MIHPLAVIDESSKLAPSVKVYQFATICARTKVGALSVIGTSVWIGRDCTIGENVRIQTGAFIPNGSVIEDHVFIGPNVTMTDDKYPRSGNTGYHAQPPHICRGASIGAGAVILPGIVVGSSAMIAAGAVVTHDVGYGEVVKGVPARVKGEVHASH
jgi:UDP-2-acetamido-3-amino-2,3-dideoxy-glucuronate N-acetyltransferase